MLPNLEWIESTTVERRITHVPYYGLILPIEHPFWTKIKPGDEWGCQCDLASTDAEPTPEDQIPPYGDYKPSKGLDNNPAHDGKLFSDSHPYFPSSSKGCGFNTINGAAPVAMIFGYTKKGCYDCAILKVLIEHSIYSAKNIRIWAKEHLKGKAISHPDIREPILISTSGIKEFSNQPHAYFYAKNKLLMHISDVLYSSIYKGVTHYKGRETLVFEIMIKNKKSWILANKTYGEIRLYSITDSEKVLIDIIK